MNDIETYQLMIKKNWLFHGQTKEELSVFMKEQHEKKNTRYKDPFGEINEVVRVVKFLSGSIILCISDKNTMSYFDGKKLKLIKRLFVVKQMYLSCVSNSGDVWRRLLHIQLNNDSWVSIAPIDRNSVSELVED